MVIATRMTLDEFLELPETKPPSEFVCGRVVPKPMPTFDHAAITSRLIGLITMYLLGKKEAMVFDNLRHAQRPESRAYLPDISVIRIERVPKTSAARQRGPVEAVPDLAVEVMSPDDRPSRVADKLAFYLRSGVALTWIVDPEDRTLTVYRPGQPSAVFSGGDEVDALPVLSTFSLKLSELFEVLEEGLEA